MHWSKDGQYMFLDVEEARQFADQVYHVQTSMRVTEYRDKVFSNIALEIVNRKDEDYKRWLQRRGEWDGSSRWQRLVGEAVKPTNDPEPVKSLLTFWCDWRVKSIPVDGQNPRSIHIKTWLAYIRAYDAMTVGREPLRVSDFLRTAWHCTDTWDRGTSMPAVLPPYALKIWISRDGQRVTPVD